MKTKTRWDYLVADLRHLNATQCRQAIGALNERLQQLENKDPRLDLELDELVLSVRAYWALIHGGLRTPRQILEYGLDRLEMLRGAGTKTVQEIRNMMDRLLSGEQTVIRPLI